MTGSQRKSRKRKATPQTSSDHVPETSTSPPRPSVSPAGPPSMIKKAENLDNLPYLSLLAFLFLTPILTSNGACDSVRHDVTVIFLAILALCSFIASFIDSAEGEDGQVYYGIATPKGMFLLDRPDPKKSGLPDLRGYRITVADLVRACLSLLVLFSVAFQDEDVTSCFKSVLKPKIRKALEILPLSTAVVCVLLYESFPNGRRGIGYFVPIRGEVSKK